MLFRPNMDRYCFAFLFLFASCSQTAPPHSNPTTISVSAMRVEPKTIPATFEYVGVGESSHIVQLRARVEGYLESIQYKEGGMVEEGELMFVLDQRPFVAEVEKAQAEVSQQKAFLWNAEQTLQRMVPLYKQNAVSQKDLDNAIAQELEAKASVDKAQAALYKAELDLGYASIVSPVNGLASQAKYREGALISPGPNDQNLLTTIYVVDPIWVNFNISDNDLLKLRKQLSLHQIEFPANKEFRIEAILADGTVVPAKGTIDFMNPAIEQATGTMLIRAVLPNPYRAIYPGLFVKVRVIGATYPNAIIVPQTAIVQGQNGTFVYVIENGKAVMKLVELGDWYENYWIVHKGLQKGDVVIVKGVNRLQNGSLVSVQTMVPSHPQS